MQLLKRGGNSFDDSMVCIMYAVEFYWKEGGIVLYLILIRCQYLLLATQILLFINFFFLPKLKCQKKSSLKVWQFLKMAKLCLGSIKAKYIQLVNGLKFGQRTSAKRVPVRPQKNGVCCINFLKYNSFFKLLSLIRASFIHGHCIYIDHWS